MALTRYLLLFVFVCSFAPCVMAAGNNKTYATLEQAATDPDFAVQGEYVGNVKNEKGETGRIGVQVIALGGGKFDAVLYHGGLPGDGADMKQPVKLTGQRQGNKTVFANDRGKIEITGTTMTAYGPDGKVEWSIQKTHRKSPTLGAKPPKGAVVLFDGTKASLKNWNKGARITDDGLLMQGVTSKAKFGNMTVHVEFRTPYQPYARGQRRGNSGLYLQGRFEVQMLDSFGLKGRINECGAIYGVKAPSVNMCLPPLSWQTYDVEFTAAKFDAHGKKIANARMTVRHNGVLVQDNTEVPHSTTASPLKEGPTPGPIYLQNHGCQVRYRNIWVVAK